MISCDCPALALDRIDLAQLLLSEIQRERHRLHRWRIRRDELNHVRQVASARAIEHETQFAAERHTRRCGGGKFQHERHDLTGRCDRRTLEQLDGVE